VCLWYPTVWKNAYQNTCKTQQHGKEIYEMTKAALKRALYALRQFLSGSTTSQFGTHPLKVVSILHIFMEQK